MKKYTLPYLLWILAVAVCILPLACGKPFKDMKAILSNDYISHRIVIQIVDAKPESIVPAGSSVSISGTGVDNRHIFNDNGTIVNLNEKIPAVSNTVILAIEPYYIISPTSPIHFSVNVTAPGYYSTTKDVLVNTGDSLQFLEIKLLKKPTSTNDPSLPKELSPKDSSFNGIVNGTLATSVSIPVNTSGPTVTNVATVAIQDNTTFLDARGATISETAPLQMNLIHFNDTCAKYIPGGINDVGTKNGRQVTFLLGSALEISGTLNNKVIDSFSKPLLASLSIRPNTYNPKTGTAIAAGDNIEIWSRKENSSIWNPEGSATVTVDGFGNLSANINIKHLSTWIVGFASDICAIPLIIKYQSNRQSINVHYLTIREQEGNQQPLGEEKIVVKDGDTISVRLPKDVNYTLKIYEGSYAEGQPIFERDLPACSATADFTYNYPANRPALYFDLLTECPTSTFDYSGPIDYKLWNSKKWKSFTPSADGRVNTSMLEFGKVYDFRIIYNRVQYLRTERICRKEEFKMLPLDKAYEEYEFTGFDSLPVRTSFLTHIGECE